MKTIFYDVDTQKDFMNAGGALYVPGAEALKPNLALLTAYARAQGIQVIASADAHNEKTPELKRNGGPFPDHCMKGTEGQKKIAETALEDALVIPVEPRQDIVARVAGAKYVLIEKDAYDVATNPNFGAAICATGAQRAVVYGVATDFCVKAAALGLKKLGLETIVVKDAVAGVFPETTAETEKLFVEAGIKYATTNEVTK